MAASAIGILPLLLFFGGFSLPLGLPPLPEDPVISRVAPKECLAYISWAGTAKPDAKSTNQTEQLLAEPEMQKLFLAIDSAVTAGIKKSSEHDTRWAEVSKDVYPLAKTLLTRPAAVFLSNVAIESRGPAGGAIVNLAEKAASVSETLERLEKLLPPGMADKVEIAGVSFHRIKISPTIAVSWGVRKNYLIVGAGEGAVEGILKRAEEQPPAWLTAIRKHLPVDRQSTLVYFNVKQTLALPLPLGGQVITLVFNALGLNNVSYLASVTGLDSKGTVARTLFAIDGEPQGVFRLAAGKPLTPADLACIPRDATIAAAGRCNASAVLILLLAQIEKVDRNALREVTRGIDEMEKTLGIGLQEDLLNPLGDVWCVYNSPGEGGLLVTGLTGVVQVKDHDRLEATLNKLIALYRDNVEHPGVEREKAGPGWSQHTPRIMETTFGGQVIYHFDVPESGFYVAPAWCLTGKELIVSTFPQNIKSYLSRGKDSQSLAAVPEVAGVLEEGNAVALSYCDTRKMAEFVYPLACIGGKFIASELNREGIPLDASLLPSAGAIFPHLHPSVGIVRHSSAGIEFESRGPLAGTGGGPLLPTSVLWFGVARADVQQNVAREQALRAETLMAASSLNNLKQIALAALNYEEAHGSYPPAYIADKATGKPLLSWRVAILPYIEQSTLYQQFHLDEPWDSENNKKLIARMPATYLSTGPKTAVGKTRYVTLRHKDSVFPGKDGVRLRDILDGTSNTILVVEADAAHAVTWTKPDDLQFDPAKPGTGLTGQPARGFNAVFCDGAARFIRDSVDLETLRNLVNRHDGKLVTIP